MSLVRVFLRQKIVSKKKEAKKRVQEKCQKNNNWKIFISKFSLRKNVENAASSRRGPRVRARETPERTQTANDDDDKDDDDDNITTEERKKCE